MAYMTGYMDDREKLGIVAIPAIGSAISTIGSLFSGNSKDPGRLQANANAYGDAVAGDPSAVTYLKARSGRFGTIPISPVWHGDPDSPLGGWATDKAKNDAYAKYQQVTIQPIAASSPSSSSVPGTVQQLPTVVAHAGVSPLLIIGALGIGYMLLKR